MTDKQLTEVIEDFVDGLLKKAKVKHAGNCFLISEYQQVIRGPEGKHPNGFQQQRQNIYPSSIKRPILKQSIKSS